MTFPHDHATVQLDPYLIAGFMPQARPELAALATSYCTLGAASVADPVSDALSVAIGSDSRWIADPAKLVDNGDGFWHWNTSAGTTPGAYWKFPAANVCVSNPTYAYDLKHGRTITKPAFIFDGDMWAQLQAFPTSLAGCTLFVVARLRRPHNAHRAGIVESRQSGSDPAGQSDVYLRLRENHVRTGVKGHVRQDLLANTRRPAVVGASHGPNQSRLIVLDNRRTLHNFHHPAVSSYDMTWYLARLGGAYSADTTAVMDVLEVDVWQTVLDSRDLRKAAQQLNGIYRALG